MSKTYVTEEEYREFIEFVKEYEKRKQERKENNIFNKMKKFFKK